LLETFFHFVRLKRELSAKSQPMIKTIAFILMGSAAVALADQIPPASTQTGVTYATDIKPIFDAACVKCHDSTKHPKAHLAMDSLAGILKGGEDGPVVVVGNSAKSFIVQSVSHVGDPDSWMPKGRPPVMKLTDAQIGLIRAWIDQGAK
jgi:mono/diheme cytochrome c family protein